MRRNTVSLLVLVALTVSACSSDTAATTTPEVVAPPENSATATTQPEAQRGVAYPVQVRHDAGVTDISSRPERIAALSATHVEMLFAIGAGPQVFAGDLFSTYPTADTARLELIDSFNLNIEAVVTLEPDLVILSFDASGWVEALAAVDIPVLLFGTAPDMKTVYDQIVALGTAVDREVEADALVTAMESQISAIVSDVASDAAGMTFYHESDPFSFYTPNSSSFIGSLYALLGMTNIADEAPDEFGSGFPQLSPEFIVASDPDLVFLAGFGETAETFSAREGWNTMSAVTSDRLIVLDYDAASRWGPRVVELVEAIADGARLGDGD